MDYPVFYSFRRCPYAMRARMGVLSSGIICELREVVLRDKPASMIELSPKGTVPVLQTCQGLVIDQSLDIMLWALKQNDPEAWLTGDLEAMLNLIKTNDQDFKTQLDHYKYATRYEDVDPIYARGQAEFFLNILEDKLSNTAYLFGDQPRLADIAIFPFIRQFANVDPVWFADTSYKNLQKWLSHFLDSARFKKIMMKYDPWHENAPQVLFS